jgi:hypothetical protein
VRRLKKKSENVIQFTLIKRVLPQPLKLFYVPRVVICVLSFEPAIESEFRSFKRQFKSPEKQKFHNLELIYFIGSTVFGSTTSFSTLSSRDLLGFFFCDFGDDDRGKSVVVLGPGVS